MFPQHPNTPAFPLLFSSPIRDFVNLLTKLIPFPFGRFDYTFQSPLDSYSTIKDKYLGDLPTLELTYLMVGGMFYEVAWG